MPRTALATAPPHPILHNPSEFAYLLNLQRQALSYFVDNQSPRTGLVFDRQRNLGPLRSHGLFSTAATGMGFISLALASAPPYRMISAGEAAGRIQRGLETALETLPHTQGILPHFVDSQTDAVVGNDARSTIDATWLIAGALWAAAFLGNSILRRLSGDLYERVNWQFWTTEDGLLRHGADPTGRLFPWCWDRLNGETVFMYVLAAGAADDRAWPARHWSKLNTVPGEAGGLQFGSADLGLFVFQYGLDLLDLRSWRLPNGYDLMEQAALATEANARVCEAQAARFQTYRSFWGLSAGDGPGGPPLGYAYRCYAPGEPVDGTAHVSATLPSLAHRPARVWENVHRAAKELDGRLRGRYGFSSVNLDQDWIASDMIGIDAGAIVIALDNLLMGNRVRETFHHVPAVQQGLERIGAKPVGFGLCPAA